MVFLESHSIVFSPLKDLHWIRFKAKGRQQVEFTYFIFSFLTAPIGILQRVVYLQLTIYLFYHLDHCDVSSVHNIQWLNYLCSANLWISSQRPHISPFIEFLNANPCDFMTKKQGEIAVVVATARDCMAASTCTVRVMVEWRRDRVPNNSLSTCYLGTRWVKHHT